MAQTMKEIIGEAYRDVSEERLRELMPNIVRSAKGDEFIKPDNELSSMMRQCLDSSSDGGMIGVLLPISGALKPHAIINRGGILGTEELDSGGFGIGNRGKKALLGMTVTEVVAVTQPVVRKKEKPLCLRCTHLYPFDAKEGERYVCCLYGKRIEKEPEGCKGFQAGANKRQMEG